METNYLLGILSFVHGEKSDGTTQLSSASVNGSIDASNTLLEAPIATQHTWGDTNRSSFTMANKYMFANLLLFMSGKGDEETSPSFVAENSGIGACSSSLEAPIATQYMQWGCEQERFTHRKQICLLIFYSLQTERATRQRRPLFKLKIQGFMLLAHCQKCSLQHSKCCGDANGSGLPRTQNYLFADPFLSLSREGDKIASPSFKTR